MKITDGYISGAMEMAITFAKAKLNIGASESLNELSAVDPIGVIYDKHQDLGNALWSLESSFKESRQFDEELEAKGAANQLTPQDVKTQEERSKSIQNDKYKVIKLTNEYKPA